MSVILNVFGNHDLIFNNYYQAIGLIEKKLNKKIYFPNEVNKESTLNENSIIYYTNHDFNSERFEEINIYTNFKLCDCIKIYKHFIQFSIIGDINLKYHIWRDFVSKTKFDKKECGTIYNKVLIEWNNTRKYLKKIIESLGGDLIIYLNDGSDFTIGLDLIVEGGDFKTVFESLNLISYPYTYRDLEDNTIDLFKSNNWFIEKIPSSS